MATSDPTPRVPSVGKDPRDRSAVQEPREKTFFRELDEAVIEADRCIQCGTCVLACPSDSIGIDEVEDRPTLVRMCTGCSRCWDFCPRSGLRYEKLLELEDADRTGDPQTYAARARDPTVRRVGQDSGTVTALLAELLDAGELDGALVARESDTEPLKGEAALVTTREDLIASAGSYYNQTMQLGHLSELVDQLDVEDPAIAVVGTPCVIQGAAALERYEWADESSPIALTIALMCTRNFGWDRLRTRLEGHGVDPAAVDRLDVSDGVLYAFDEDRTVLLDVPVEDFDGAALYGCAECTDFVGGAADISAGNVGSPDGYTTVVIRSDRGSSAWELARIGLEMNHLQEASAVDRLAAWNERRAKQALPRPYDPDGSLTISYGEHRGAYDETARAPQPLNPARVYQYEEWC